jgi:hypothetical protein
MRQWRDALIVCFAIAALLGLIDRLAGPHATGRHVLAMGTMVKPTMPANGARDARDN